MQTRCILCRTRTSLHPHMLMVNYVNTTGLFRPNQSLKSHNYNSTRTPKIHLLLPTQGQRHVLCFFVAEELNLTLFIDLNTEKCEKYFNFREVIWDQL